MTNNKDMYDLYTRTTADGSKQVEGVDFDISYAPIANLYMVGHNH